MAKGYYAPSVIKAFEILKLIASIKEGIGISEIARELGIAKSTVHGMTSALEEVGAVGRDPLTKRYTLGFTLFELGKTAYSQIELKDLARPFMEELMERTQTSVFLGLLNSDHVTILEIVEPRTELKITSPIGTTIPLFAGAAGKVFLAMMDENQALRVIGSKGLTRYTENSITDVDRYIEEIGSVKAKGFATDDEEYILGVRAVAAPILGVGHAMSAIWAVGFKTSLDEDKMKALAAFTKETAEAIRRKVERQPPILA
ncbi:MAG: IclR family transcriptional regulator [Deltaproteobacteria bacterium]|nr:IclR family transcriptional regulator [Deltaproteobacteria bacterium]